MNGASFAAHAAFAGIHYFAVWPGSWERHGVGQPVPLGTTLADATVLMAGNTLPLFFGSNGQINGVVSAGINTNTSQQIVLQRDNTLSIPISVDVGPAEPAVFGYPAPGDPPNRARS